MSKSHADEDLVAAVLEYLTEHPSAMDTLNGIADWWLERQRAEVEIGALSRVVHRLVDCGVLQRVGSGDEARYRLPAPIAKPGGNPESE